MAAEGGIEMSDFGGTAVSIFVMVAGLVIEAMFFYLFDIEPKEVPALLLVVIWFFNSGVLAYLFYRFFGDGRNGKDGKDGRK